MLNIGIIGCGKIAQVRHVPEYLENGRCRLAGFYDCDPARSRALADACHAEAFPTLESLLDSGLDAVSVCSANTSHADQTVAALSRGLHVLCEKPMATTLADCERMVSAAACSGKLLMLGHNQRLAKSHVEAKRLIDGGALGRVLAFHTTFGHPGPEGWTGLRNSWFFDKRRAALGVLADLGIHKTDLIHYLLGDPIVKVSALLATQDKTYPDGAPIDVEDNAYCLYETRGGARGTLHVSWTFYGQEDNATRIYGEKGILRLYDDPEASLILETRDGDVQRFALDQLTTNKAQTSGGRTSTGIIDAFVSTILDHAPCPIDGAEALKAMRVVFAAEQSARLGRMLSVEQP